MIHHYVRIVAEDDTYIVESSTAFGAVRQYVENTGSTEGIKDVTGFDPVTSDEEHFALYRVTSYVFNF